MKLGSNKIIKKRYKLLEKLGEGGIGDVFLAEDLVLARRVAIKSIREEYWNNADVRKRINRECSLHARLGVHQNIVTLHDKLESNGQIYLILEYVEGETLANFIHKRTTDRKRISVNESIEIISQSLEALSYIHGYDILHRDIKPTNIILKKSSNGVNNAKLMDFGIACLENNEDALTRLTTMSVGAPGTPLYMAPERFDPDQFESEGPWTDLYSVGIVLYEMIEGVTPFRGSVTELLKGHLVEVPEFTEPQSYSFEQLQKITLKALSKKKVDRYQSANDFLVALQKLKRSMCDQSSDVVSNKNNAHTQLFTRIPHKRHIREVIEKGRTNHIKTPYSRNIKVVFFILLLFALFGMSPSLNIWSMFSNNCVAIFDKIYHKSSQDITGVPSQDMAVEKTVNDVKLKSISLKTINTSDVSEGYEKKYRSLEVINSGKPRTISSTKYLSNKKNIDNSALDEFFKARANQSVKDYPLGFKKSESKVISANLSKPIASVSNNKNSQLSSIKRSSKTKCAKLRKSYQLGDTSKFRQYVQECAN